MSDEAITLELLGARMMGLTAACGICSSVLALLRRGSWRSNDGSARWRIVFPGSKRRMDAIEDRMGRLEDRIGRVLSLVVRIAERQGVQE